MLLITARPLNSTPPPTKTNPPHTTKPKTKKKAPPEQTKKKPTLLFPTPARQPLTMNYGPVCPDYIDTCPTVKGFDPIGNYM